MKTYNLERMTDHERMEILKELMNVRKKYLLLCLTLILNPIFAGAALKAENYYQFIQSKGAHTSSLGFRLLILLVSGPFGFIFWWLFEYTPLGSLIMGFRIK